MHATGNVRWRPDAPFLARHRIVPSNVGMDVLHNQRICLSVPVHGLCPAPDDDEGSNKEGRPTTKTTDEALENAL